MTPTDPAFWSLDPTVTFLNHGSFGACPRTVLADQTAWRERMEAEPVRFLARELNGLLAEVRRALGGFVGADPDDLALVPNATAGVNTVLRSLRFEAGDELLTTDHEYNASLNALRAAAARDGAGVVVARVPFPSAGAGEVVAAVMAAVTNRTRLVLLDHVTSLTGLIFPVEQLVAELAHHGIDVLIDGAHGPGMVPLDLDSLGAAYYSGNCHKWLCAPKGSAFLHVRRNRQSTVHPLAISHGANDPRLEPSRFRLEFDWTGTADPSPWLSIPAAIESVGSLVPGGWPELMAENHELALRARDMLCARLGAAPPAPDAMLGSMAALPLPVSWPGTDEADAASDDLSQRLLDDCGIEVPIIPWPAPWLVRSGDLPAGTAFRGLVRVSAQRYNVPAQYEQLGDALLSILIRA